MDMSFNFNKVKRSFFTVTLKAPEGMIPRRLVVKMPKKKTFEKVTAAQSADMDNMTMEDAYDTLGSIIAEILNNNMGGEHVTLQEITDNYDLEEMDAFLDSFMAFVDGKAKSDPN